MRKNEGVTDRTLWVALSLIDHVGSKTLRALIQHFGDDPQAILTADPARLQQVPGIGPKIAHSIQAADLAQVEQALRDWDDAGLIVATCIGPDALYPPRLLGLDDPPATLFMRGHWQPVDNKAVAVVGTRAPSSHAAALAGQVGAALAEQGVTVVSGLAMGVDAAAHEGALSLPTGRTLAVLGCGVRNIYPPQHHDLALRCQQRGVVLSEVNPAAAPSASRLVARNRIISGLSRAVIVVETLDNGGAMHAARFAHRQGRPVFTFDLETSGNRQLLAEGALPLEQDLSNLDRVLAHLEGE